MKFTNEAGTIEGLYINHSKNALDIYRDLNPEKFPDNISVESIFHHSVEEIYRIHGQTGNIQSNELKNKALPQSNKVVLAFSGGLDSMYQAFELREQNLDVTLFHVKNMNYYTNGKEYQAVEEFADKYNFPLVVYTFKQNTKNTEYKKFWRENSFKNMLLYSMILDYCLEEGINNISSGDDLRLNPKDCVIGTNVADVNKVTLQFFSDVIKFYPIRFLPTKATHKGIRLQYLKDKDALDMFYSCVNPGRFNQSNHERINKKFNVQMEKWNCGVCRKCAFHSLLRYYYLHENYPQEFIDFCWNKIANGADFVFFNPELPLETRIKNLFDY